MENKDKEIERLRVQLAGCSVAALGGVEEVGKEDYGWSASYQDVLELRKKYEALLSKSAVMRVKEDLKEHGAKVKLL